MTTRFTFPTPDCFYDGGLGYSDYRCLINPDSGYPYRNYYAFSVFNSLYSLGTQVKSEQGDGGVFVCAARNGRRGCIALANPYDCEIRLTLDISGMPTEYAQICRIDGENRYTVTGESLVNGIITLPPYGCAEIKLYDLG